MKLLFENWRKFVAEQDDPNATVLFDPREEPVEDSIPGLSDWLKENERKTKNIIEGLSPLYTWGNRFSIYTGFPTVIGWDWHQTQQREYKTSLINERKNDVNEFYSTLDVSKKINILNKYDVKLVIIGEQEKSYYPNEGYF